MPLAPVLAAALTTPTARSKGLYIGGLDVIASPIAGVPYGCDPADVTVIEAGPGQVSSLVATIDDTTSLITPSLGAIVLMHDHVLDLPLFLGFVQSYRNRRVGIGRAITLRAIGIEILLDWLYVPALTLPAGTDYNAGVQSIAAQAVGIGAPALRAGDDGGTHLSSVAFPVGTGFGGVNTTSVFTWDGGTLRQALTAYGAFLVAQIQAPFSFVWSITIDFYGGLRFFRLTPSAGSSGRSDNGLVTLRTDGASKPSSTEYGINQTGAPRTAYMLGSGAGIGAVSDGTGFPGPTIAVTDPNSTTAAAKNALGAQYLGAPDQLASGTVGWDGAVLSSNPTLSSRRAGDYVDILDPQAGLAALARFPMQRITKTWAPSGEEAWRIDFGGEVPHATHLIRRLTRSALR
jgi:hypothetical protein